MPRELGMFDLVAEKLSNSNKIKVKLLAKLESSEKHIKEIFDIARQHKVTCNTLNTAAFDDVRKIVDILVEEDEITLAIDLVYKCPDIIDRSLCLHYLMDLKEKTKNN